MKKKGGEVARALNCPDSYFYYYVERKQERGICNVKYAAQTEREMERKGLEGKTEQNILRLLGMPRKKGHPDAFAPCSHDSGHTDIVFCSKRCLAVARRCIISQSIKYTQ